MSDKTRLFPHYFKATEHLDEVDVYQVLKLFDPQDPSTALGHAVKKILLPGSRGSKGRKQDIEEAIASLQRYLDINYGDSSRASHEMKAELVREYEDLSANIPSLRGEQDLRAGIAGLKTPDDTVEDKPLTLREFLAHPANANALKAMDSGTPVTDKMRKQIQEGINEMQQLAYEYFKSTYPADEQAADFEARRAAIQQNYDEERERIHSEMMHGKGKDIVIVIRNNKK